jgi:subtilisin family serine protease
MPWWMEAGTGKMRLMFLLITLLHSTEKECISHLFARSLCSSLDRTHVAGTTCGAQYGVSRNCKLCAVQVLPAAGSGPLSNVLAGINHVVSKCSAPGSRCVANLSLGAGFSATLNQAVAAAVNAGVVMVVSAGNSNVDACTASPASEPLAITVGSTTEADARSGFSNWGTCVDVYAPGSNIKSSWRSSPTATATMNGTSMASPRE